MAELSANNRAYLQSVVNEGEATIPALVYAKLKDLGFVTKVEGKTAGRGKTVVTATIAGKQAVA